MNYNKLLSILPDHEISHISDCEKEYQQPGRTWVLFEYTTNYWPGTIDLLKKHNIDFTVCTDSYDLDYILI